MYLFMYSSNFVKDNSGKFINLKLEAITHLLNIETRLFVCASFIFVNLLLYFARLLIVTLFICGFEWLREVLIFGRNTNKLRFKSSNNGILFKYLNLIWTGESAET